MTTTIAPTTNAGVEAEQAFGFLRTNPRRAKPPHEGLTETRGPYYSVMGPRCLADVLETMGWRATPFYTDRERAALAWAEAVTLISHGPVPNVLYDDARHHFLEKELVDLSLALVAINGRNRLSIPFRTVPGTYQPKAPAPAATESRKGAMA
jgi:hypothetical protein